MTDDDFLRQILADPGDDALRLVYADWLDEQGDPRGEYLRFLTTLPGLTSKTDPFVQAHRRLNELRASLNSAWVELVHRATLLPQMDLATHAAITELRGFLNAFSWTNGKTNHQYSFEVFLLAKRGSVVQTITPVIWANRLISVTLEPLNDWQTELSVAFPNWLCLYLTDLDHLLDPSQHFSLSRADSRTALGQQVVQMVANLIRPTAAFQVQVESAGFYECAFADYALEAPDRVLFIHLGVSD
jgi:uncharacterized protein (TIGR02996 family)